MQQNNTKNATQNTNTTHIPKQYKINTTINKKMHQKIQQNTTRNKQKIPDDAANNAKIR